MAKRLELMAATFSTPEQAELILDTLQKMHRASNITLADAAMVTKDDEGKIHIKETREVTGAKGAKRGAIALGVVGLIFPPSLIASAVAGGVIGGAWGKLRDTGIKTGSMKEIAEELKPGNAAVIALSEPDWVTEIERTLQAGHGRLFKHGFTDEESDQIEQAAATDADETEQAAEASSPTAGSTTTSPA